MKGVNKYATSNAFLWACAVLAAAVLSKGTEQMMIVILAALGGASVCYSRYEGEKK